MAISTMPVPRLVARFNAQRLAYDVALTSWPPFGRGWCLRVVDELMEA
jgi:lysozyme family protein